MKQNFGSNSPYFDHFNHFSSFVSSTGMQPICILAFKLQGGRLTTISLIQYPLFPFLYWNILFINSPHLCKTSQSFLCSIGQSHERSHLVQETFSHLVCACVCADWITPDASCLLCPWDRNFHSFFFQSTSASIKSQVNLILNEQ